MRILIHIACFFFFSVSVIYAQSFSGTFISNPKFKGEDQIVIVHKKSSKQFDGKLKIKGLKNKKKLFDYLAGEGKPKDVEKLISKYANGKNIISVFYATDSFQEKEYSQYVFMSYKTSDNKYAFIVIKEVSVNFDTPPHTTKSFNWEMSAK